MKDEIKEILDNLEDAGFMYKRISPEEIKKIIDYITNLQEENKQTKLLKERYQLEKETYKSRNEKAIEYIGNGNIGIPRKTRDKFIAILKGEDKDE